MSANSNPESTKWRVKLNNVLQRSYGRNALTWEEDFSGAQHSGIWEAMACIRDAEYGRGRGRSRNEAREAAARVAYYELFRELYGTDPDM